MIDVSEVGDFLELANAPGTVRGTSDTGLCACVSDAGEVEFRGGGDGYWELAGDVGGFADLGQAGGVCV